MNLRQFAGVTYPIGSNFSNIAMQTDSPYAVSWWYHKQFSVPASYKGKTVWLNFKGINYRAAIWLNGKQIANSNDVAGAWRTYEFNVTDAVNAGADNTLAVQVWAPTENDLAITFVDWNPAPPDKNMGLWGEVYLTTSGPVALRYPTVVSKLNLPAGDRAQLTVTAQVKNGTGQAVKGKLKGKIENISFEQEVELAPHEAKDVTFTPEQYPQLAFSNPRLWWPAQMGKPNLYPLAVEFVVNGEVSDRSESRFGIREVTSDFNSVGGRVFHVNGKNILIRGGGWTNDMMLRENSQRLEDEFRYVGDMGSYLQRFPAETLKIDRSFVNELDQISENATIVRAIIGLGESLALSVIAEGVERPAQVSRLQALGCHLAQGYLFGRPLAACSLGEFPRDDLSSWTEQHATSPHPDRSSCVSEVRP